jgi:Xaa-Pro aminopeptidase
LIPFDQRLIDWAQLTADERTWLERYHQQVRESIAPMLTGTEHAWLQEACTTAD